MTDTATETVIVGESPVEVPRPAPDDIRFWSVTTIIGALDKPALIPWAANATAQEAVRICKTLAQRVEDDGPTETVRWLAAARFRKPEGQRSATDLGTAVHDAVEQYALTGERPTVDEEIAPFLEQFDRWAQVWQPEYAAAEMTVYSPTYGYAGTLDAIARLQGSTLLLDYKTTARRDEPGKPTGPYPEVALQMAAYRWAELAATWRPRRHELFRRRYYLLGPEERDMAVAVPEVDGAVAVHITPDHCTAYPIRCDQAVHTAFLYVLEAARWAFETSKSVIGEPLLHAEEDPS